MADILNIEGLEVDVENTQETSDQITIQAKRRPEGREMCPHCGGSIMVKLMEEEAIHDLSTELSGYPNFKKLIFSLDIPSPNH